MKSPTVSRAGRGARGATASAVAPAKLLSMYETMLRIRVFELRAADLFNEGLLKGAAHSYAGEEAIAAGVCAALNVDDYIGSYHRGHGHCIAKGATTDRMMAELLARANGYCGGIGGSMHIADLSLGILGANGIVGATMPLCTGAALASHLRQSGQVAVAFFGDGASNQGVFHESLNLAAVWKLPILFVCENNEYALNTPYHATTAGPSIARRADAYGIPGLQLDGNDVEAVHRAASEAVARARAGQGPTLLECMTYRWGKHSMRAAMADPRPPEELQAWMEQRDPITRVEEQIVRRKILTRGEVAVRRAGIEAEIQAAVDFAMAGPQPTLEAAMASVYAPHAVVPEPKGLPARNLSFAQALSEAMAQEMARDPNVFVMGEDIGAMGGVMGATRGLFERFGPERVRDTPISEATFVGAGVGAALAGMRPVVELQIFDFVTVAMDMIVNQAAKMRFMLGGRATVPLVVRGPQGGGIRYAAQHSQSLETWFTHVPGLVVLAPSSPHDAKGLLISAIREDNPVVFLESKLLYNMGPGPVPEASYAIPVGKGEVKREGTDVTVVATMAMVPRALAAATQLAKEGISVEVIDPRTLRPLDEDLILESVRKTHRLVVAHEACVAHGFGAEVAALVNEKAFDWLDAPILRVGAPPLPMPYNDELERATIPSQERITDAIREVLR